METLKVQRTRLKNAGLSNYMRNEFRLEAAAAIWPQLQRHDDDDDDDGGDSNGGGDDFQMLPK